MLWHGGHPEPVAPEGSEDELDVELEEMGIVDSPLQVDMPEVAGDTVEEDVHEIVVDDDM